MKQLRFKTSRGMARLLFLFLSCNLIALSMYAQSFIGPAAYEDTYPAPGTINITQHTSAYSWANLNFGGMTADVVLAGWDDFAGTVSGASWRYLQPTNPAVIFNQGVIPYPNCKDIEVGILQSGVGPEMLVAYYLNGVGHFVDVYTITPGGPVFGYSVALSTMPNYTRISMDCHLLYATAITWQDNQSINTIVGLTGGGGITFSGILNLANTPTDMIPDCAFSHTPMAGTLNVHYAYYDPNSGNITESSYDFWIMIWMLGGTVPVAINDVNFVGWGALPYEEVLNIDCPGHYDVENWAYTYTMNRADISVRYIDWHTTATPTTIIVNNGTFGTAINGSTNSHPFCAYDQNHAPGAASFQVGWHTYAIDPATGVTAGYVSNQIHESGTWQLNPILPTWDYQTVANNPTWATQWPVLSFSKQDDNFPYLYTVFPEFDPMFGAYRLENKYHKWSAPQFKGEVHNAFTCDDEAKIEEFNKKHQASSRFVAYPNPYTATFMLNIPAAYQQDKSQVTITNIAGMIVGSYDGLTADVNTYLANISKQLSVGTYMLNINVQGKAKETLKIVKTE